MKLRNLILAVSALALLECATQAQPSFFPGNSILNSLQSITASTIPASGEVNPYGIAFVPQGFPSGGPTTAGSVLIANFNNSMNQQGTGTTIVSISPTGQQTLFATSTPVGLDTALGVLSRGFVIVGNLPVTYNSMGQITNIGQGSLQIFNHGGTLIATLNDSTLLDSPWDLTIRDRGSSAQIFVSNVLSGTVTRLDVSVSSSAVTVNKETKIASGYPTAPNSAAVVVGPTGLAYDASRDILYVASTTDSTIYGVTDAGDRTSSNGRGFTVYNDQHGLHGPLGLVQAPNGNLITANGDAVNAGGTQNDLVEFTPQGNLVATYQLDAGNPGGAFGIAIISSQGGVKFAAVDDDLNTVTVWNLSSPFLEFGFKD